MVKLGPGLRPQRPTPHGPPTGSGGREKWFIDGRRKWETERFLSAFSQRYPLGKGGEKPFFFLLFPPVNEPPLPPARAGGRAMRRWSLRPQARPLPDGTTFPRSSHQRMGFQGEGTSFPLVFFPLFLQRNRAPPGRAPFPPVPTAPGKNPTPPEHIPPGMGIDFSDHNLYNVSQPNSCCGRGEPR